MLLRDHTQRVLGQSSCKSPCPNTPACPREGHRRLQPPVARHTAAHRACWRRRLLLSAGQRDPWHDFRHGELLYTHATPTFKSRPLPSDITGSALHCISRRGGSNGAASSRPTASSSIAIAAADALNISCSCRSRALHSSILSRHSRKLRNLSKQRKLQGEQHRPHASTGLAENSWTSRKSLPLSDESYPQAETVVAPVVMSGTGTSEWIRKCEHFLTTNAFHTSCPKQSSDFPNHFVANEHAVPSSRAHLISSEPLRTWHRQDHHCHHHHPPESQPAAAQFANMFSWNQPGPRRTNKQNASQVAQF